jgi:hypothetical protein
MKKFFTTRRCVQAAFVLAAFAGAAPAFAQSAGTWSAGISGRNGRPYVDTPATNRGGYGSFAEFPGPDYLDSAPSTNHSGYGAFAEILGPGYFDLAPSSLGPTDRFGVGTQR